MTARNNSGQTGKMSLPQQRSPIFAAMAGRQSRYYSLRLRPHHKTRNKKKRSRLEHATRFPQLTRLPALSPTVPCYDEKLAREREREGEREAYTSR